VTTDRATDNLFLSEEQPWPLEGSAEELSRLPSFMKELNAKGVEKVKSDSKEVDTPDRLRYCGREVVSEGKGLRAALVLGDFRFCLAPGCGVAYSGQQNARNVAKLATLAWNNRSTATTILAVRALIEMQSNQNLDKEARKTPQLHRQPAGRVPFAGWPLQRFCSSGHSCARRSTRQPSSEVTPA